MVTPEGFNRLSISVRDFEQAIAFAERAAGTAKDDLAYQAFLLAAVVSYYRPFSPNERSQTAKATSSLSIDEFRSLDADELALHEKCKILRNKALAHSEYDMNPTSLDRVSGVISSRPFDLLARGPDPHKLATLATKLANACHHWRADHVLHPSGGMSAA